MSPENIYIPKKSYTTGYDALKIDKSFKKISNFREEIQL